MDPTQIILIVFIALLIIAYPIMIVTRNKKENARMQEQTNSLKRGDKVLTTSGVYGTIIDLHQEGDKTIVTLETGSTKNKGYISVDAYAVYMVIKDEPVETEKPAEEAKPVETTTAEVAEEKKTAESEGKTAEDKPVEEVKAENVEAEKPTKKSKKKK